jgi:hypothetical protein
VLWRQRHVAGVHRAHDAGAVVRPAGEVVSFALQLVDLVARLIQLRLELAFVDRCEFGCCQSLGDARPVPSSERRHDRGKFWFVARVDKGVGEASELSPQFRQRGTGGRCGPLEPLRKLISDHGG